MKDVLLGTALIVAGIGLVVFHRQVGDHFRSRPDAVPAPRWLYRYPLIVVGLIAIAMGVVGIVR